MVTTYPTVSSTLSSTWMPLVIEEGDLIFAVCPHCRSCGMFSELKNCLDCSKNIPSSGIKEVRKKDGEILKVAVNESGIPFVNIPPPKTIIKYPIRRKNFTHETKRKKSIENIANGHAANRKEECDEELLKEMRMKKELFQKIHKRRTQCKPIFTQNKYFACFTGTVKEVIIKERESNKYPNIDRNKDLQNDFMNENCSSYPSEKQNSIITIDSKSSMPDVPIKAPSIFSSIMALNKKNDIDSANKLKKKEYFFNSSKDQNSVSTSIKERKMSDMSFETPITSVSEDISSDMLLNKKYCTIDKQNLPIIVYGKLVTLKDIKAINNSKIEEYLSGSSKMQTFVNLDNRKRKMSDESNVKPYKCIKLFEINEISNFDSLKKQNIMNLINKPKNTDTKFIEIDLASKKLPDITEGESPSTNAGIIDGSSRPKNIGLFNIKNQDKLIVSKIIKIINFDQSELNSSNNKNVQTQTKHKLSSNKDIKIFSENQTNSEHNVSNNVDVKVVSEDQAQSELLAQSEITSENQTENEHDVSNNEDQIKNKLNIYINKDSETVKGNQAQSELNVPNDIAVKDNIEDQKENASNYEDSGVINEYQNQSELKTPKNVQDKKTSHMEYPCISELDLQRLDEKNLLNDTVIQFYLGYIYNEKLPKKIQDKTHIFNSYFLEKLECRNQTGNSLEKWLKRINIFEKNFIVFPKNLKVGPIGHWFLVVVCFLPMLPKLPEGECDTESEGGSDAESKAENDAELNVENDAETGAEINVENNAESNAESEVRTESQFELQQNSEDSAEDIKRPCICFFDSLDCGAPKLDEHKKKVFKDLKYFFKQFWKKSGKESVDWRHLICINAICPLQKNFRDCGVFLLQYAESFFQKPIKKFQDPLDVKHWFKADIISDKRKEIQQIISEKMKSFEKS